MSGPGDSAREPSTAEDSPSVLAKLPSTRPQRASARRAAARTARTPSGGPERNGSAAAATAKPRSARKPKAASGAPRRKRGTAAGAREQAPRIPRQGFESERDATRGTVHPPGGTELIASAFEIVGELAKSGVTTGERLLRDVFSRVTPS